MYGIKSNVNPIDENSYYFPMGLILLLLRFNYFKRFFLPCVLPRDEISYCFSIKLLSLLLGVNYICDAY